MKPSPMPNRVFIGLGANLGDPAFNLQKALQLLEASFKTDFSVSPVYRSEPVGVREQPWFLNQVACFYDNLRLGPTAILKILKGIEIQMGREPTIRFGPRLIDLDLLLYENWVLETGSLVIPHPRLTQRSFVLLPLLDLEPALVDPRSGTALREIWDRNRNSFSECYKE